MPSTAFKGASSAKPTIVMTNEGEHTIMYGWTRLPNVLQNCLFSFIGPSIWTETSLSLGIMIYCQCCHMSNTRSHPQLPKQKGHRGCQLKKSAHCQLPVRLKGSMQVLCPGELLCSAPISQHHHHPLCASRQKLWDHPTVKCKSFHPLFYQNKSWKGPKDQGMKQCRSSVTENVIVMDVEVRKKWRWRQPGSSNWCTGAGRDEWG